MREEARKILVEVVKKAGEEAWRSGGNCQGLLKDYGGNEHGEITVLSSAVQHGAVERLRG